MKQTDYVVITPVRNEADHLGSTIRSMVDQTCRPIRWIIVDDGSSDSTPRILDAAAKQHSWIHVVRRPDRGMRKSGAGVVEAFYDGYPAIAGFPWEFLVKLDADLSFDPEYFVGCFARFRKDLALGIGGGTVCIVENGKIVVESKGDPPFHVRGATKIYRRECWEDIAPLLQAPGWDTIDEVKANMRGWRTCTFTDLRLIQLKATGKADGVWLNWYKNGRGCYMSGYDPLFMMAKCLKRALQKPLVVPGLALGVGFCSGYWRGLPQPSDRGVISYLRKQQRRRLLFRNSIYG
jgi:poly-beta-1,6-N-acetyl-D-glucosamine synthase